MTDLDATFPQPLAADSGETSSLLQRFFWAKPPKASVLFSCLALLILIAYLDYITPPELNLSMAYALPATIVTWYAGRAAGATMCLTCAFAEFLSDRYSNVAHIAVGIAMWNAVVRTALLLLAMLLLAAFKDLSIRLGVLVEQRTNSVRKLAAQLSEIEETERRRLAHDLHDGLGQMLSLLKLNLASTLAQTPESSPQSKRLQESLEMVNELVQRTRTLTFDLHPPMLDHLGLAATLQHFCEQFHRHSGVIATVDEQGPRQPLPRIAADSLFRSVKELINNAAKHGPAKEVVTSLHWTPGRLRIIVDDDGPGFDPAPVLAGGAKGLGLAGIRERMLPLGGAMRLESSAGSGARVVLEIPLTPKETV